MLRISLWFIGFLLCLPAGLPAEGMAGRLFVGDY